MNSIIWCKKKASATIDVSIGAKPPFDYDPTILLVLRCDCSNGFGLSLMSSNNVEFPKESLT